MTDGLLELRVHLDLPKTHCRAILAPARDFERSRFNVKYEPNPSLQFPTIRPNCELVRVQSYFIGFVLQQLTPFV
jgi:hypothetical protein